MNSSEKGKDNIRLDVVLPTNVQQVLSQQNLFSHLLSCDETSGLLNTETKLNKKPKLLDNH